MEQSTPTSHRRPPTTWLSLQRLPLALRYVDAAGWHTRVLEAGDPSATTVVLLSGTGGHLEAYTHNVEALSKHFHVIAYDFPGHGFTTLTDRDLEIADYLEHLEALLDVLGLDRVHLTGESLGGWVAAKFAAQHPERVRRLILNTPGGTMVRPEVMERVRTLSQDAADDPSETRIRVRLEWLMADPTTVTDELVGIRQAIYAQPGFSESMRHLLALQYPEARQRNLITDAELASIAAPSLVVWTSDDPSGPAAAGIRMAALIPAGAFHLIEGAGHWPQWEQSETFNDLAVTFLLADDSEANESD